MRLGLVIFSVALLTGCCVEARAGESVTESAARHERVAKRRAGVGVICHRGASEFAHENTLEAYRASFELGADGNEIDVRSTRDGVLVCFHDGTIEQQLTGLGEVADYSLEELAALRFREPGRFGEAARIPELTEVLELHRRYGGLLHLDIKQAGIDKKVAELLEQLDMWDQVAHCNVDHAQAILQNAHYKPRVYKGQLYEEHAEVDPDAISAMLKRPGDDVIVDDPRGVVVALGRKMRKPAGEAVAPRPAARRAERSETVAQLLATLRDATDWDRVAETPAEQLASARRIIARARAADGLLEQREKTLEVLDALAERAIHRSLHKDWRYQGLDGATALRALIELGDARGVEVARRTIWREDDDLAKVSDPQWGLPPAWADFRIKQFAFPCLARCPGAATERLCRDYLALSEAQAKALGPPLFDAAARALLRIRPDTPTALDLLRHPLSVVRGRAILECLAQAKSPWARRALHEGAPQALQYLPPEE